MFINSDPPQFRKARELAISIESQEALFLGHTSYVDTTLLVHLSEHIVQEALVDPNRNHGFIAPFLRTRIKEGVAWHEVMEPAHRDKVVLD